MGKMVTVPVYIEGTGELIELEVEEENAKRMYSDPEFALQMWAADNERRTVEFIEDNEETEYMNENETQVNDAFIWNPTSTKLLLTLYEEKRDEFENGTKRHNHLWGKIAQQLGKPPYNYDVTGAQCQSKLNGLKRTYKNILDNVSESDRKPWPYFERMHELFSNTNWAQPKAVNTEVEPQSPIPCTSTTDPGCLSDDTTPKSNVNPVSANLGRGRPGRPSSRSVPMISLQNSFEEYKKEMKEERAKYREEKMKKLDEYIKHSQEKFEKLLAQKERQHQEKMAMMKLLLENISKTLLSRTPNEIPVQNIKPDPLEADDEYRSVEFIENIEETDDDDPLADEESTMELIKDTEKTVDINDNESQVNDMFIWIPPCTKLLLTLYEERRDEFENRKKRHSFLWREISQQMGSPPYNYNVTWGQCQSKLNCLKRTYNKILNQKNVSGRKTWPYFERMHELFSYTDRMKPKVEPQSPTPCTSTPASGFQSDDTTPTRAHKRSLQNSKEYTKEIKGERTTYRKKIQKIHEYEKHSQNMFEKLMAQKERHQEKKATIKLVYENSKKEI